MRSTTTYRQVLWGAISYLLTLPIVSLADAQDEVRTSTASEGPIEGITVLGSRRAARSSSDSAVPIDILRSQDLNKQGNTDIIDTLISVVPSLNANREPISNEATLVRPLNLRGLPSDHTLVLVNGKRRHRGSVINEFVTGVNRGAQGVDIYPLFGFGLRQVEVLRDGASAQYGSDAIAGVVNYSLIDDPYARMASLQFSQAYEGDGTTLEANGVFGVPLGEDGFVTLAFQVRDQDSTSRGAQDNGALALSEAGFTIEDPVVEWGQPNVRDDYKFTLNSGFNITPDSEIYAFATFSRRNVDGSFYFRNPTRRGGVFVDPASATNNALFADLTGEGGCPEQPLPSDSFAATQAFIESAPANCFSFLSRFPNGFTPRFGGDVEDISIFTGFKGTVFTDLNYDFSVGFGENKTILSISNTVNASLGPNSPTYFEIGSQAQSEVIANIDFAYSHEIARLASPLNIAFGFQYLNEEFEIAPGELDSFRIGPFATQGFSIGSNGFQGFSGDVSGIFGRDAYSLYLDAEVDITQWLLLTGAVRYEEFSDFGDTINGKISTLVRIIDAFALRGSLSTGFRAPTLGQSNLQRSTTTFLDGLLSETLLIATTDPIAEIFGGGPLDPETSLNISIGFALSLGSFDLTLDYFRITVDDRIALLRNELTPENQNALTELGIPNVSSLSQVQFFINDFDTRTQGIDIVANYRLKWAGGNTNFVLAGNWTDTEVSNPGSTLNEAIRQREIEESLPEFRFTGTINHTYQSLDGLIRINYYSDVFETLFNDPSLPVVTPDLVLVDVELGLQFTEIVRIAVGAKNVFDTFPAEWSLPDGSTGRTAGFLGAVYPLNHPAGFNGGSYYVRLTAAL